MTQSPQKGPAQDRADVLSRLTPEDTILWQGPALALAAQAFLLTIALAKDATRFAGVLSSLLAFVTAGAAWYLIWRKGRQVKGLEEQHGIKLSGPGLSASAV
jgi:membrane protein implicated in regulation of membrane protease activity